VTPSPRIVDVALELSWATLLAESCTLTGVSGAVAATGSATVTPSMAEPLPTAFTLTAVNGPQTTIATVDVAWGASAGEMTPVSGRALARIWYYTQQA
jgi:hypothetical protein